MAYYVIDNLAEQREKEIVQDRIQEYRAWFEEGGIRALKARFDQQPNPQGDIFFVRIVGPLNQVLFLKFPQGFEGLDPRRLKGMQPGKKDFWLSLEDASDKGAWTVGMASLPGGITLQVGKSSARSRELLSYFRTVVLIFMIPILLLGVIGGAWSPFVPLNRFGASLRPSKIFCGPERRACAFRCARKGGRWMNWWVVQ